MPTATNELGWADAWMRQWAQFGHRCAVAGDDDALAALDAAEDLSPLLRNSRTVTEPMTVSVSPVRQVTRAGVRPRDPGRAAGRRHMPAVERVVVDACVQMAMTRTSSAKPENSPAFRV